MPRTFLIEDHLATNNKWAAKIQEILIEEYIFQRKSQ
jgi:hypothetical protein